MKKSISNLYKLFITLTLFFICSNRIIYSTLSKNPNICSISYFDVPTDKLNIQISQISKSERIARLIPPIFIIGKSQKVIVDLNTNQSHVENNSLILFDDRPGLRLFNGSVSQDLTSTPNKVVNSRYISESSNLRFVFEYKDGKWQPAKEEAIPNSLPNEFWVVGKVVAGTLIDPLPIYAREEGAEIGIKVKLK